MPSPVPFVRAASSVALVFVLGVQPGRAQPEGAEPPPSPLTLESVAVTPEKPGPGTLVQLRVGVANQGEKIASQLAFRVTVNGQDLPVYANQIFMQALPPGETSEVRLYNFWTTETFRPLPADKKLHLEVSLVEAHWYRIEDVEEEGETIEEWTPLEPVPGLPATRSLDLDLAQGPPGPYAGLEQEGSPPKPAPANGEEEAGGEESEPSPDRR